MNSIDESSPKIIRSPKGPDGSNGFSVSFRAKRSPGKHNILPTQTYCKIYTV